MPACKPHLHAFFRFFIADDSAVWREIYVDL